MNTHVSGATIPPPLHYHDVFVLTRSSELHDEVTDETGHVTSPASGVVRGLREADIPVCVMGSVVTIDDEVKWRRNADDIAVAKSDRVIVGDYRAVVGLERKIVVYLPGRWQGVDDQRNEEAIDAMDRVFAMSRCTAQLIVVEVPDDSHATLQKSGGGDPVAGGGRSPYRTVLTPDTIERPRAGQWPIIFTKDDL
ncbi:hypothetical protein BaRGS_00028695 [Batillaria attramentaria]|uniref:Uncharacterized protein n=1 Tax=Batillaria attramentaria TaxID=370345 RepID=A0ABD0JZQ6_9CAEN